MNRMILNAATAAAFVFLLLLFLPVEAALSIGGFLTPRFELVWSAGLGIVFTTLIYGVIAGRVAAPGQPVWRIIDLDEPRLNRVSWPDVRRFGFEIEDYHIHFRGRCAACRQRRTRRAPRRRATTKSQ